MDRGYADGFVEKCAEYGVDPEAVVKAANKGLVGLELRKAIAELLGKKPPLTNTLIGATSTLPGTSKMTGGMRSEHITNHIKNPKALLDLRAALSAQVQQRRIPSGPIWGDMTWLGK